MKSPFEYLWGYKFGKLTTTGSTRFLTDAYATLLCVTLLMWLPKAQQGASGAEQWIIAAILVVMAVYALLPAIVRLTQGDYYEHEEEPGE